MADVDMTDAPPVAKKKGGDSEAKKRFEVKKVRKTNARMLQYLSRSYTVGQTLTMKPIVERRRSLGLGHRRRQLRHLPQSYHGPLYVLLTADSVSYRL